MITNNSRSTTLISTFTFLHLAFAFESFVVHSIFTLHYLHCYSSNYFIAIVMNKLSASRERALKNARRVKTKKKKKKKKTIEARQIAKLRIIEKEVEQSKKNRVARRQVKENEVEISKKNLLDIDELNIISTIRNKIVKSLEKLSTNEIIEKITNCKMMKFLVIYLDENVAYLISSSMMSTIIKSNKHFVLIFFVADKMIKSDMKSYSKLYTKLINFDIDRICQTDIVVRDRNKY